VRKKKFKGRCEKRVIAKCNEVCRTYDVIQYAYADILQVSDEDAHIKITRFIQPCSLLKLQS